MFARTLLAFSLGLALHALAAGASAQFAVSTTKTIYDGKEPLFVAETFVNSSMQPISYSTRTAHGTDATIWYAIHAVDAENRNTTPPSFKVERGAQSLQVRWINVRGVSSGFSGELGPGKSFGLGGTLGFGIPFNLMLAPPATTGATLELVTESNQSIVLAPGERIAILTPGTFHVTALIDDIEINGYTYARSSTGYLAADAYFDIQPKTRAQLGTAGR